MIDFAKNYSPHQIWIHQIWYICKYLSLIQQNDNFEDYILSCSSNIIHEHKFQIINRFNEHLRTRVHHMFPSTSREAQIFTRYRGYRGYSLKLCRKKTKELSKKEEKFLTNEY